MPRHLVLDCAFGIAGDMLAGALLDLGADEGAVRRAVEGLPLDGFGLRVSRVERSGLSACDFDVALDEAHDGHDHDMAYLHGGEGEAHGGHRAHAHAGHTHRTLPDVLGIIAASDASDAAKALAARTFRILAEAEGKAHGMAPDEVGFHEVGAVDSIVDILAASVAIDSLGVDGVICESLADGHGTVRCQHGIIPVPVPAVVNIVAAEGLVLRHVDVEGELTTPTGAALVAAARTGDALPASYRVLGSGLGAGKRSYGCPSYLRVLLIEDTSGDACGGDAAWRLETDLDDCAGEALGHALDRLMAAGAREAHCVPLQMKKGRPGWQLQVICDEGHRATLEGIIFEDTTTIGIRRERFDRTVLPREEVAVETEFGTVAAKRVTLPSGLPRAYPEHDDVARLAAERGIPYQEAWQAAVAACSHAAG
ncbi:MAG: nickel pincer cofactor biosynthesis protein LarC [Atopobiaceae bacterium]|jgi:uncharacterized protein (TIGR00299 family) protein|nr:nickel pincer cofactor biosynthesis protein LarC [Atopobiaceae bacterium]